MPTGRTDFDPNPTRAEMLPANDTPTPGFNVFLDLLVGRSNRNLTERTSTKPLCNLAAWLENQREIKTNPGLPLSSLSRPPFAPKVTSRGGHQDAPLFSRSLPS